jgi:surface carbohydrate biosynthesis protein (TIGR04326 family)
MKCILIFDCNIRVSELASLGGIFEHSEIFLFPLTGDLSVTDKVKTSLEGGKCASVKLIDAGSLIEQEVREVGAKICSWSAEVGDARIGSKSLKEWLVLPGSNVSTWWFSLLSEKNTLKTDVFLKIAQLKAIRNILREGVYDNCCISVSDGRLVKGILTVARRASKRQYIIGSLGPDSIKQRLKYFQQKLGFLGMFFSGFYNLFRFYWQGTEARRYLGNLKKRMPTVDSLLFVTYFPAVEESVSSRGVFKNKYAMHLQDKFREWNCEVVWLLMYVSIDKYTFKDALKMAKRFVKNGEKLFMMEEFISFRIVLQTSIIWLWQIVLSFVMYRRVKNSKLTNEPFIYECAPLLKSLWYESFCGYVGLSGILYYLTYSEMFKKFANITDCLYYCEMHAWEKGLNAARNKAKPGVRTIGFVHASVPKNYFPYFYDRSEIRANGNSMSMPLPDIIACNGEIVRLMLEESGYDNLVTVEAVRHLHIERVPSKWQKKTEGKPVLLVAGSIDRNESKALVSFVHSAFPNSTEIEILFQSHPALPLDGIFTEYGIDLDELGYKITGGSIERSLGKAWVVFVAGSTVAIEALAYGCGVFVPILPDSILVNPLEGFDEYFDSVRSPSELVKGIKSAISKDTSRDRDKAAKFVKQYWCLDPDLNRWRRLLLNTR